MYNCELSIIIVSFNTAELLKNCLDSLFHYLINIDFEIIVVDNNSTDSSKEMMTSYEKRESRLKCICLDSNIGFGSANNVGIKIANGRNILFLNSDTYLIDSSIITMIDWFNSNNQNVFGAGCLLLNKDLTFGVSYGEFPNLQTILKEIVLNRFCKYRAITPSKNDIIKEIDFPCGAFFLVKNDLLKKTGVFDERFFLYFEETDLAKRAKDAGYKILYYGFSKVVHLGGASAERRSKFITRLNYQSWSKYIIKHHGHVNAFLVKNSLYLFFIIKRYIAKLLHKKKTVDYLSDELSGLISGWNRCD
jgi:GT2 family glycosyltransferase